MVFIKVRKIGGYGMIECTSSPNGKHGYSPEEYTRDDQMFYCSCVHCNITDSFYCDTEDEWWSLWGLNDED